MMGKEPITSQNGKLDQMNLKLMEALSYDDLDDDTGMLEIVDEEDVALNDTMPQQSMPGEASESMDNIDTEQYEDDSNQFEILPDEDDEDAGASGEEEGFLEKVLEESEDDLNDENNTDANKNKNLEVKEGDDAVEIELAGAKTPTSPQTQRKFLKIPDVLSPGRPHKKHLSSPSPGASNGSGKLRFIPQSVEKVIRSKMASYKGNEDSVDLSQTVQERSEEFFSDDSSSGDSSLGSLLLEDDDEETLDVSKMGVLPNTFLNPPPTSYDYLDQDMMKNVDRQNLAKFAWEHHLLTKGLMQLMAERDHIGVEDDVDDSDNVLKMGPLKLLKRNLKQKTWTVKLVELRKGNLTFYDDKAMKGGKNVRTTVHLRKRTCRCEAVANAKDLSSSGFVFALIDEGAKRHWMCKSEEEMEGWIRSINKAMIGETDESMDLPLNMAQYQKAVEEFESVRNFLGNAETQKDYMAAAGNMLRRHGSTGTAALRVPMRWVREEVFEDQDMEEQEGNKKKDAPRHRVKSAVADFWKLLCATSIAINGRLVEGKSQYSGERIIGALSRCLLEYDKVDRDLSHKGSLGFVKRKDTENFLTEAQAVSHARNILAGALKSKDRQEGLLTVKKLMENENVVKCVEVKHREPMHIDVSFAGDDFSGEYEEEKNDHSGFAQSRIKENKSWKERYLVLSEGVLTIYMDANPRPYGLRGQFVLKDTKVETTDEEMVIKLHDKDNQQRQILFDDRSDFVKWKFAMDPSSFDSNEPCFDPSLVTAPSVDNDPELKKAPPPAASAANPDSNDEGEQKKKSRMGTATMVKLQKEAKDTGERAYKVMKGARDAGIDKIKKIMPKPPRRRRRRQPRRRPTVDMLLTSTRALQMASGKREPTVQVVVELRRVFNVIAKDPTGEGQTLVQVKVKLFHAFLVSGGANGRLARGDELIDMEFINGDVVPDTDATFLEVPTAL